MKVGFLQFAPVFGEIESNLDKVASMLDQVDADLIVLPELFNTGYLFTSRGEAERLAEEIPAGKTTRVLAELARKQRLHIVAGICEKDGGNLYNSAILVTPRGYEGRYRKVHLYHEETLWFQPGNEGFKVFDTGICRLGIMICFDWFFPEAARALALQGAQIICHSANLVLPFCQDGMVTRCLENHVFAVTANRTGADRREDKELRFTGKSQITGPAGAVICRAGSDTEEIGIVDIDVQEADDKDLNRYNNLFTGRRPEFYPDCPPSK